MLHGDIPPGRFLPYLRSPEIAARPDLADAVVVWPAGAVEQHGPHLPCAVDALIAQAVVGRALARLPEDVPAFALPTLVYGASVEHAAFPGTLSLDPRTLLDQVVQVGHGLHRSGFRKLLIVNAHGGQPEVMALAARELRAAHADFVVVPHWLWAVPHAGRTLIDEAEQRLGLHAGQRETALMLALAPELVRLDLAQAHRPAPFGAPTLSPDGRPAAAWMAQDLSPDGTIGDPRGATADQGREILATLVGSWARAITELHALRWPPAAAASPSTRTPA